jgi:hypothetical protein
MTGQPVITSRDLQLLHSASSSSLYHPKYLLSNDIRHKHTINFDHFYLLSRNTNPERLLLRSDIARGSYHSLPIVYFFTKQYRGGRYSQDYLKA